jgi:hypothetical protein
MSNIRIDNIAPSAGGTYRNAPRGIAAAWVQYDCDPSAIEDSSNVSSLTDIAVGQHEVNYTNNLSNSNYAILSGDQGGSSGSQSFYSSLRDASYVRYNSYNGANAFQDYDSVSLCLMGDLA